MKMTKTGEIKFRYSNILRKWMQKTTQHQIRLLCFVVVVVKHEFNMVYFPEAGNLNGSNTDMCSDVAGLSISDLGDLFELSDRSHY